MSEHAAVVVARLLGRGSPRVVPTPHDHVRRVRALYEGLRRVHRVPGANGQKKYQQPTTRSNENTQDRQEMGKHTRPTKEPRETTK